MAQDASQPSRGAASSNGTANGQKRNISDLCIRSFKAQQDLVKDNPLQFGAFAMILLPHVEELKFVKETQKEELKPDGFAVVTSHAYKFIGDSTFDPVWAELNKLSATFFVHPGEIDMPRGLEFPPCKRCFPKALHLSF